MNLCLTYVCWRGTTRAVMRPQSRQRRASRKSSGSKVVPGAHARGSSTPPSSPGPRTRCRGSRSARRGEPTASLLGVVGLGDDGLDVQDDGATGVTALELSQEAGAHATAACGVVDGEVEEVEQAGAGATHGPGQGDRIRAGRTGRSGGLVPPGDEVDAAAQAEHVDERPGNALILGEGTQVEVMRPAVGSAGEADAAGSHRTSSSPCR